MKSRLRKLILARWSSCGEFSRVAGCDPSLVSHVLAGRRRLTKRRVRVWGLLLGVDSEALKPFVGKNRG
jgi:hypothetical protein